MTYDLANAKYTAQDATTARKGIIQLSNATDSTSETLAATPKAVK
ncbi:tail fiber protein, partial [Salmonella enterica]